MRSKSLPLLPACATSATLCTAALVADDLLSSWNDSVPKKTIYNIPPEQAVGSSVKLKFKFRGGEPVLLKLPAVDLIDDKEGKPIGIQSHIGRRPIFACEK